MLLAFGADLNPLNNSNKTPLDISAGKFATLEHSESLVEIIPIQSAAVTEGKQSTTKYLNEAGVLLSKCGAVFGRNLAAHHPPTEVEQVESFLEMTLTEKEEDGLPSKDTGMRVEDDWCKKLSKIHFEVESHINSLLEDVNGSLVSGKESLDKAASLGLQIREMRLLQMAGSRVLFLDGGGMRGLLEIEMLSQIEKRTGRKIVELFDWIVGTSTGAIIALGLVYGK